MIKPFRSIYSVSSLPYLLLFFHSLILFQACTSKIRIKNPELNVRNALQASIRFETSGQAGAAIEYRETGSTDIKKKFSESEGQDHHLTLFKLEPNTGYSYRIRCFSGSDTVISEANSFKTPPLPVTFSRLNVTIDSGHVFDGYILLRKAEDPAIQFMIDQTGAPVWYHAYDTAVSRFYSWTDENTILSLKDEDLIQELDLHSNILFELGRGEKGFTDPLHHEIIKDGSGNIHSLTRNMKLFDLSERGGLEKDTIFGDGILVLDSTGQKIWEWDIYEFEDPLEDPRIDRMKKDWSHGNSLDIDTDGHYLVSFRNFHQVWKIHSGTGEIIWKLGMDGDFDLDEDEIFLSQHTAHINRFGELMIFDNGGPERMYSRAISFRIMGKGKYRPGKIKLRLPGELYSFKEGSAYLIDDEKILFCSSRTNNQVITNLKGDILWQLRSSDSFYRAYYIPEIPAFDDQPIHEIL